MNRDALQEIIDNFEIEKFIHFFRAKNNKFKPRVEKLQHYSDNSFTNGFKLGEIEFDTKGERFIVCAFNVSKSLTEKRGKKEQYEKGKKILKELKQDGGIFIFYDTDNNFRFSLIYPEYTGTHRSWNNFRRFTYLVKEAQTNKTFLQRIGNGDFSTIEKIKDAFSVEKVTEEFYEQFHKLFWDLGDVLQKNETFLSQAKTYNLKLDNFAKKLLGQIVFLYFVEKKGWLGVSNNMEWGHGDKNFLTNLYKQSESKGKNFFNDYLEELFYSALNNDRRESVDPSFSKYFNCRIPFLNGGLFEPEYNWKESKICLDNKIFSTIFEVFDQYNFTVEEESPEDKDVAVDPEMLGKVFENLLEIEDRKYKGTYYTPREIVQYMCRESLINYLLVNLKVKEKNKLRISDGIRELVGGTLYIKDEELQSIENDEELENIAGHIYIFTKNEAININNLLENIKVIDPACGSGAFLIGILRIVVDVRMFLDKWYLKTGVTEYELKKETIQNCIYGVDIDSSAIDIAKLRLWLSLIVDYELSEIKPLPNLDYKIVCGDSLLDIEKNLLNFKLFNELEDLKPKFFYETSGNKKKEYKKRIEKIISELTDGHRIFDFEVFFSEVFHKNNGFDVVIANPPYVTTKYGKINDAQKKMYLKKFESAYDKIDLYVLFFEKAIKIAKIQGLITFISPWNFVSNFYSFKIRKFLLDNVRVKIFNKLPPNIFNGIIVDNIISVFQKDPNNSGNIILFDDLLDKSKQILINQDKYKSNDKYVFDFPKGDMADAILKKMQQGSEPLGKIALNYIGIMTGGQKEMISSKPTFKNSKPVLSGKDIFRWFYVNKRNYVNFDKEKIHSNDNEKVYLSNRKILLRKTGKRLTACLDTKQFFTIQS